MAKAHTAPILGHMGQPEALLEGKLAQLDQLLDAGLSREGLVVAMPVDLIFGRFTTSAMNVRTRSRMSSSSGVRVKSMAMATPERWTVRR